MQLASGDRLGPYEIVAAIGAGGMGEVYQARDTRLERTVAIKTLSAHLDTAAARERFEREARAVSSLNDPHICTLYDIGQQGSTHFLVLEYLEGETLGAALRKGPLPFQRALRYAVEIARALDRAHRHGVIHRDLKPGNIMLTKTGTKLLDFGLAKFKDAGRLGEADATATLSRELTSPGTIVGTFQYMAPEQLEGKQADARSDLFAFGAVLYEMLTARKAFEGNSQASLIAAILTTEPRPLGGIPPALERIVRTCLAKDPDERWQSAGDLARELQWIAEPGSQADEATAGEAGRAKGGKVARGTVLGWAVAAAAMVAAAAGFTLYWRKPAIEPQSIRFTIPTEARLASHVRISPDGTKVAFDGQNAEGKIVIWIRPLDKLEARALPGTENARHLFWSPDSRYVGFCDWQQHKIKRVDPAGGQPQIICDAQRALGATWGRDGTILFGTADAGVYRVPAAGGVPVAVTTAAAPMIHSFPEFLPDGKHFLYFSLSSARTSSARDTGASMVGSLDGKESIRLGPSQYQPVFAPANSQFPAHLLTVRDGSLMAQEFDADRLQLRGEPIRVVDAVAVDVNYTFGDFSVSRNGILALNSGLFQTELVWFDRAGNRLGAGIAADKFSHPALSPDGKQVVFERMDAKSHDSILWQLDTGRGEVSLFARSGQLPVFSPDSKAVVFRCGKGDKTAVCREPAGGAAEAEILWDADQISPIDISPDGSTLSYLRRESAGGSVGVVAVTGEKRARNFYGGQTGGAFSPDGKWMAYGSMETGESEVYVQPYPATGAKFKVSTRGGAQPRWRRDGKELFYRTIDGKMMAVAVKTGSGFEAAPPQHLFSSPADPLFPNLGISYAVSADGQRFLINAAMDGTRGSPVTIITNWAATLGQ